MRKRRHPVMVVLLLMLALVVAACGGARQQPAPGEVPVDPAPSTTPPPSTVSVALYFADWQAQHLIPEQRQVPEAEGAALADLVVKELLKGPTDPHLNRTIPAEVKQVEPVTVQGGIAYVNLSREFLQIGGAAGVQMALGSLVQSLTDIPGISKVQVLVEGKKETLMDPGLVLEPMERGFYGDIPFFFDPERAKYLEERVAQGLDPWRTDPAKVVQWEGRMFGFTAAELQNARVETDGDSATASLSRDGKTYVITLKQQGNAWVITGIK
ncbi:MAG TPA: GerMN domain-containing protein, partial [Symbiobacteriaceae bacterium]